MPAIRLATWNINSVRLRAPLVQKFLKKHAPDVLCLQETKVVNELFPREIFAKLGYAHHAIHGQKGYHGVAILSRLPFTHTETLQFCGTEDCRHISVRLACGLELHNFYVPAGGDIPDPKKNEKFAHKLSFLEEMESRFSKMRKKRNTPVAMVGDLNVAPLEHDVWSHKQLLDVVSHTPVECALLGRLQASNDWVDIGRHFHPAPARLYTWWSYRAKDWAASDRGRRLDHVWVTPDLVPALRSQTVHKDARDWEKGSDHVPVCVEIAV